MGEFAQQDGEHLRLIWPQWQGGGTASVRELAAEFPFDVGRRGYAVGSAVLAAVLPTHSGPSATLPVSMAVSALVGQADEEVQALLPATIAPDRVALVGLHAWTEDDYPHIAEWGLPSFSPDQLRDSSEPMLDWLRATGCSWVAIHFDVDTIDSDEIELGLGAEPDGLTSAEVRQILDDVGRMAEVVGLTIAEFIPRQVMHLQQILTSFPLLNGLVSPVGEPAGSSAQEVRACLEL